MINAYGLVAGLLLTSFVSLGQTTPLNAPGGAVTVQPGSVPANSPGTVQPQTPTPATPAGTAISSAPSPDANAPAPALTVSGFKRFSDPLLESLIQLGLDNSPNLRAALSRVEEARIRVRVAQSFLSPSIRSSALITSQSLSERRPLSVPNQADLLPRFQLNTFQLLPIDASYELDLFKRIRNTINVADLQAQASDADFQSFRLTLASDIARTYLLIRGNDAEQSVFVRNIQSRDSTLAILRERFRAGLISQIDVQRSETDYATLQVTLKGLARARIELVNGLAQLCGQNPNQFQIPAGNLPSQVPQYPYATVQLDQLQRRPDLLQYARQNQIAIAQVVLQQASTQPRVTLIGSAGILSGRIGPWFTPSSATYIVGVNASVPLYEGHRARQNIALARQQTQTNQQTYQQALQLAQRDAETALDNQSLLREQIDLQQQTLSLARRTERYNRELYIRGLATYLEVLDAQRTILTVEQQLVQLRSQEAQYAVALLRAVGGDYQ
ncbi:efflux transporter outer membrane subunit [Spirosoma rhododendri]|uniref:Efflux transporter outer membrane subunit n=1 Tax=Spirosoma rhododendri TaxID=2728024 RepID=A0A7L5DSN1_9BACT|nr:efflux transporter outer membrane subunit [Spirosoma rhododendri]QJD78570.1 efflux transporter outer membrane subunit [Spirosoma rhododendri]